MRYIQVSLTVAVGFAAGYAAADAPTFTKDVLPIIQQNCQVCHRDGGANLSGMVAPMAFTTYEETRPWAKAIGKQVLNRTMPPWHAAPEHAGVFNNERALTEDEIAEGPEAKVTAGNETTANRDNLVGRLQRVKRKSTKV